MIECCCFCNKCLFNCGTRVIIRRVACCVVIVTVNVGKETMKLLLTAFTPFDGEKINPALEAMKLVKDRIDDVEVVKVEVPTVFRKSIQVVTEAIEKEEPDFVLSIGQAGGREGITPERVAINIDDARIPDNEGNQPIDEPIFPDGANAYFSTLPVKAMVEAIRREGLPSSLSNSAGTYVCNHLMYGILYFLKKKNCQVGNGHLQYKDSCLLNDGEEKRQAVKAGFIHVPYLPEQTKNQKNLPSLPLLDMVRGPEAAICAIAENEVDLKKAYGCEC